jgi:hypothetical protein
MNYGGEEYEVLSGKWLGTSLRVKVKFPVDLAFLSLPPHPITYNIH